MSVIRGGRILKPVELNDESTLDNSNKQQRSLSPAVSCQNVFREKMSISRYLSDDTVKDLIPLYLRGWTTNVLKQQRWRNNTCKPEESYIFQMS